MSTPHNCIDTYCDSICNEGYVAYMADEDADANPYDQGTAENELWSAGYNHGAHNEASFYNHES